MQVCKCDLCGNEIAIGERHTDWWECDGRKFRVVIEVHTGNGRWNHLWKLAEVCRNCYAEHCAIPKQIGDTPPTSG